MIKRTILLMLSIFSLNLFAQTEDTTEQRLNAWFTDAKLGIFIHWGYYGVNGITESWSMYHKRISYTDYLKQGQKFTASNYNPDQWLDLFERVGAKYVVLTTKHHDGVALWNTKYSNLSTVKHASARKDLLTPFVEAVRKKNMKLGLYYSLCDWSHPDYQPVTFQRSDVRKLYPQKGQQKMTSWERFTAFNFNQLEELSQFKPDLWWFDGDWEHKPEEWKSKEIKEKLLFWNPQTVVNSRLNQYGDYKTPEQGVPVVRPEGAWEFCMTMNDNWGYFPTDTNYKPIAQIIRTFVEVIGSGGNLLLNVGPKPDGTIPQEQVLRLEALGNWISKHKTAVFDTQAGLPYGHFFGPTLLSKDKTKIYLCLFDNPKNYILLKGIQNKVKSIKVLGAEQELSFERNGGAAWNNIPGILRISVPADQSLDPYVTVLEVHLEGELSLYRGHGNAVELNM
ncbi:alpha-L-fucosidase [Capnocytophaga canimorsus]|uniref:alpha-L-fucosidase n=1 Tax=Capnocytophaga canimorsus TaxID=28188 RepID=UPI001BB36742|nr:alpha-L-fucosidase [Capnocytophaga canimorsus]